MALILFDLDGTLIDSSSGIFATLAHAFAKIDAPLPGPEVLHGWIGPPFWQSFPSVLGDDPVRIEAAIAHYRTRYEEIGWSEHRIYAGIAELIESLASERHTLAVVTTKPEAQARTIVAHLPFGDAFSRVYGAPISARACAKAPMIAQALADAHVDARDAVMCGDRYFDIEGARANRVRALGVLWGFGSRAELESAGADDIAEDVATLARLLAREGAGALRPA